MQQATVKVFYPDRHYGFLKNPEGGKDIFFRTNGRTEAGPEPTKGNVVGILNLTKTEDGPRATRWRLLNARGTGPQH